MDARPQRQARPAYATNNENLPWPKDILHQHTKSAGVLQKSASTIGLTGAFKANPRRAAFQDLSNNGRHTIREEASITSRLRQATITQVRDPAPAQEPKDAQRPWPSAYLQHDIQNRPDALVGLAARSDVVGARRRGTSLISTAQEAGCIQQGAKEAFLQPPQKLTSVAKGGYVTHPPSTAGTRLIHGNESQRPDGARPYPASKKTMPIWCDQTVVPEQGPHHQALPDAPANGRETVSEVGLAADLLRSIVDGQDVSQQPQPQPQPQPQQAIRHFKSQPQLKAQPGAHVLRRTKSRIPAQIKEMESEVLTQDEIDQRVVDQLVDEGFSVVSYPESEPIDNLPEDMASPISCHEDNYEIGAPSSTSEPEEYWDEEEDEDQGDEQGYVTAHSTKSRAESTTGAATTVVLPVFTSRERELLEIAEKDVINKITPQELEDDMYDISMVAEYSDEIFEYMRELESRMLPNPHYMDNQTEIQWSMRAVLIDWVVQVHIRFSLLPETLFLAVNYIDRFLSTKIVSLGKLQLVGATAIFLAAKYEEINCPSVGEIVYMVDGGYTNEEILKAERYMLSMLQFELGYPGPMSFLRRISKADDYDLETRTLAKYFLEVTIMDERFVGSPCSYIAAAAHCLARMMLKKGEWTSAHTHYSGYTINQLKPICELIFDCCHDAERHHTAVFEKYSDKKYKQAATFVQDQINAGIKLDYRSFDPEKVDMAKLLPDDYVEMQRLLIHEGMV